MNIQEIKKIAKSLGIKNRSRDKVVLIKNIQIEEGNFDCFATAKSGYCDQTGCLWRDDCLKISTKGLDS